MEQAELKRKNEFERRKQNEREKKKNKILAHKKLVARQIAKRYLTGVKDNGYKHLCDISFFTHTFKEMVLEQNVMPWFYQEVEKHVSNMKNLYTFPDNFLNDHFSGFLNEHEHTVKQEKHRLEAVRREKEKIERERLEEKERRREAREK